MNRIRRRLPLAIIMVLAVAGAVVSDGWPIQRFDLLIMDFLRPAPRLALRPDPVSVISVQRADVDALPDWNDPAARRRLWAQVLRKLHELGAKVISLDMIFTQPCHDPTADEDLQHAIEQAGMVVLAGFDAVDLRVAARDALGRRLASTFVRSHDELLQRSQGVGHANVLPGPDQIVREIPLALIESDPKTRVPVATIHALSVETVRVGQHLSPADLRLDGRRLQLGPQKLLLDDDGCLHYRLRQFLPGINHFSLTELLHDRVPATAIEDKFVVVGNELVGELNSDIHPTPHGAKFGVQIQASAICNLLQGDFYRKVYAHERYAALLVSAAVAVVFFPVQKRWTSLASLAVAGVVCLWASHAWLRTKGVMLPTSQMLGVLAIGFVSAVLLDLGWWRRKANQGAVFINRLGEASRKIRAEAPPGVKSDQTTPLVFQFQKQEVDPNHHIHRTAETIANLINAEIAVSAWMEEASQEWRQVLVKGRSPAVIPLLTPLLEWVAHASAPVTLGASDRRLLPVGIRNCLGLATRGNRSAGVMVFLNKQTTDLDEQRDFTDEDIAVAVSLATEGSMAQENYELAQLVQSAHLDTVLRLSVAAEYRDQETGHHIQRIQEYSALLAQAIGLPTREVELLRKASAMHDIGKLAIPDAILLKPGRLDLEEIKVMQQHTIIGARLLAGSPSELLQVSEQIALTHHERYDGAGYPNNLAGDRIPLYGRVVALADVFDALTSKRCYKEAMDPDLTLVQMQAQAGKHFDPELTKTFIAQRSRLLAIRNAWTAV